MLEKGKTEAKLKFEIELSSSGRVGAAVTRARGGVGVARGGGGMFTYLATLSTVSTVSTVSSNPVIPGEIICIPVEEWRCSLLSTFLEIRSSKTHSLYNSTESQINQMIDSLCNS